MFLSFRYQWWRICCLFQPTQEGKIPYQFLHQPILSVLERMHSKQDPANWLYLLLAKSTRSQLQPSTCVLGIFAGPIKPCHILLSENTTLTLLVCTIYFVAVLMSSLTNELNWTGTELHCFNHMLSRTYIFVAFSGNILVSGDFGCWVSSATTAFYYHVFP